MFSLYYQRLRVWWLRSPYTGRDVVLIAVMCLVLIITWSFDAWLRYRADLVDQRGEKQRAAICAILAGLPSDSPPYILTARRQFAPPGHPRACDHIFPKPQAHRPQPKQTHTGVNQPGHTTSRIVIVPSSTSTNHHATSPSKHRTSPTKPPSPPSTSPTPPPTPRPLPTVCTPVVRACI